MNDQPAINKLPSDTTPVVIVDGSFYMYRAYHALPPLSTKAGFPTNAIRGVASMLMSLQDNYPASPLIVAMDAPGKTFRSDRYPKYKAHRPPMPPELRMQIGKIAELIDAMGLPRLCEKGVEADDVIGTLATKSAQLGRAVVISSGDKDLMQLVAPLISVIDTMRNISYDAQGVKQKYGIGPNLIIDFLALGGDSSDNIPGVKGIGAKTAVTLLNDFGGLDDLYGNLDKIRSSSMRGAKGIADKLEKHKDDAYLSQWLATINVEVPLAIDLAGLKPAVIQAEALTALFAELEFLSLVQRVKNLGYLSGAKPETADGSDDKQSNTDWQASAVLDEPTLHKWIKRLRAAPYFALDTETTALDYMQARLVGISVAVGEDEGVYIPMGHNYEGAPPQLSEQVVLDALKPLLEDRDCYKIGHNLKYDRAVLANHGIALRGIKRDTMLESYVLEANRRRRNLSSLVQEHLGLRPRTYEEVAGKGVKQIPFNKVNLAAATPYAVADACGAWALDGKLYAQLSTQKTLHNIFEELEMPLLVVLSDMERHGVLIDPVLLKKQSTSFEGQIANLRDEIWQIAGSQFNPDSPKQLQEILYHQLNLPIFDKTPQGQPSTAEHVLKKLSSRHPLPKILLSYRELVKLKSTYTDRLPERIQPDTGRIHSSWHQASVATGRLSSSDPNLQNIPIRTEHGRSIRCAFIAPPEHVLLAADYSQIELRVMAHMSNDENMCRAFSEDEDIHSMTASEIFNVSLSSVNDAQRRSAKAINFGLIYGMSAFGLARQLVIDQKQAQDYINLYFERYPKVLDYMNSMRAQVREFGYVQTLSGRKLRIDAIDSKQASHRRGAERAAINAPIQGTAAEVIKHAMLKVHEAFPPGDKRGRMIMQVHDELVLEVHKTAIEEVSAIVRELMESAMSFKVPLKVDIGVGNHWDEAHS